MIKQLLIENTRVFIKNKLLNLLGAILIAISLFITFALVNYNDNNPSINTVTSINFLNELYTSYIISDILLQFLGLTSYLIPTHFLYYGIKLLQNNITHNYFKKFFATIILIILFSIITSFFFNEYNVIGSFFSEKILELRTNKYAFYTTITSILLSCFLLLVYSFEINLLSILKKITSLINREQILSKNIEDVRFNIKSFKLPSNISSSKKPRRKQLNSSNIYMLPPPELLKAGKQLDIKRNKSYYHEQSELLIKTLNDFGITGEIVDISSGPVVSLFKLQPSPGIKSSRVISLSNDIARSMSATSVRVSVIPGKNVIGIEIPNEKREIVYLRDLLDTQLFEKFPSPLAIALGKGIEGNPVIVDLAQMPHLLVAGTTGSGKSVAINTMILSILYRLSPEACKLILIDPKMLELSVYEGIPHLLTPVVTDPKKAVSALKWAVKEMERRYQIMSKISVRNIYSYNEKVNVAIKSGESIFREYQVGFNENGKPMFEREVIENEIFPHIIIVVDEMADLMLVAGKDIEMAVQRLAQMARAAGIHLIMATQRPSVDVITGTIKANFPTRISFNVSSKIDSRTILGEQGAEQLLGKGDMLYMSNASTITRIHGPFVSDEEVEMVVAYLKTQGNPTYESEITAIEDEASIYQTEEDLEEDPLYQEALSLIRREGKASTSFIQRHLKIGYNRAARMIDKMEKSNIISTPDHVGRRKIIG